MSSMMRSGQRTETISLNTRQPVSLVRFTKLLVGAAITLAAIGLGQIITKENAPLVGIVGFLGAFSVDLSNSRTRAGRPTSSSSATSRFAITSRDGLRDHDTPVSSRSDLGS